MLVVAVNALVKGAERLGCGGQAKPRLDQTSRRPVPKCLNRAPSPLHEAVCCTLLCAPVAVRGKCLLFLNVEPATLATTVRLY